MQVSRHAPGDYTIRTDSYVYEVRRNDGTSPAHESHILGWWYGERVDSTGPAPPPARYAPVCFEAPTLRELKSQILALEVFE